MANAHSVSRMIDVLVDGDPQIRFKRVPPTFIEDAGAKGPFPVTVFSGQAGFDGA